MVTSGLVFVALGVALVTVGRLGLARRLLPQIPTALGRNFAVQVLFGAALIGAGLILLLEGHTALVALLTLPTVAFFFMGLWAALVRPPAWLRPRPPERRDETLPGGPR